MARYFWALAIRRGLVGGSRPWMTILAVLGLARLVKRMSRSIPETVYCERLRPGQSLILTHHRDRRQDDELR